MTDPAAPPQVEPLDGSFASVLCVVAHPDDIEYGTAAAVHRWVGEGTTVAYYLLTRGEAGIDTMAPEEAARVREEEERESARRVGVDTVDFGDHPDGAIEYGVALRRDISRAIRRHRPELVVAQTWGLRFGGGMVSQADHRAVGLATLDAVANGRPIENPRNTRRPWSPRYFVRRSAWHALDHAWEIEDRIED